MLTLSRTVSLYTHIAHADFLLIHQWNEYEIRFKCHECLFNGIKSLASTKRSQIELKQSILDSDRLCECLRSIYSTYAYISMNERRSFYANGSSIEIALTHIIFAITWFALLFACSPPCTLIQTLRLHELNNIKRQMVVYTRARVDICNLSDNWHESQWDTMIKWLIPMHSLNDCEISMFAKTETTMAKSCVCERKKWKKKINQHRNHEIVF